MKLSKKLIVAGSSIIEFDNNEKYNSKFTEGCFPTIINQKNFQKKCTKYKYENIIFNGPKNTLVLYG